ncbi:MULTISPECIES: hypothetical protein [Actinoalloteichus]|uniref:Secreted protein n=1 Tax=Actinoalloteichus caeruleus DSM 43889 TaxID=1120930 RepID=A0ABT1JBF3_ACTCY|nr:hypothetical protein [Actinoalloteichus caeruleus]MCP2329835.1 hypothetical protein [Actinoalloteichus caeruleus DSM 43889]
MTTTHHLALRVALGALISAAALLDRPLLPDQGPAPVDGPSPPAVATWHGPADAGEHDAVDRQGARPTSAPATGGPPLLVDGPRTPWRLCGDSHHGRYAFSPAGKPLRCAPTPEVHDAPGDEWRWQPVPRLP